jgi:uncharacterized FlaG/YvyC family protein
MKIEPVVTGAVPQEALVNAASPSQRNPAANPAADLVAAPASPSGTKPTTEAELQEEVSNLQNAPRAQVQPEIVSYHVAADKQIYLDVVDKNTGQVIRQVPPADLLNSEVELYELLRAQHARAEETSKG